MWATHQWLPSAPFDDSGLPPEKGQKIRVVLEELMEACSKIWFQEKDFRAEIKGSIQRYFDRTKTKKKKGNGFSKCIPQWFLLEMRDFIRQVIAEKEEEKRNGHGLERS